MGCPKIVLKGNLSEMVSNWQISIGYEDNQIMTLFRVAFHNAQFDPSVASLSTATALSEWLAGPITM